jgi:hypothetical protein
MRAVLVILFLATLAAAAAIVWAIPTECKLYAAGTGDFGLNLGYAPYTVEFYAPDQDVKVKFVNITSSAVWPKGDTGDDYFNVFAGVPRSFQTSAMADSIHVDRTSSTALEVTWQ